MSQCIKPFLTHLQDINLEKYQLRYQNQLSNMNSAFIPPYFKPFKTHL
jgi:hypothetical protein